MKKLLLGLVGLLVILVAALFVVPPMLGGVVKEKAAAAVKEATGRELVIGDLSLSVFPSISVTVRDVTLSNAAGLPSPEMVTLGSLELEMGLFPLLGSSVEVNKLALSDLAVFLERGDDGRANWDFGTTGEPAETEEPGEFPLADVVLQGVSLSGAQISFIDLQSGQTIQIGDLGLTAALPGLAGSLDLKGGLVMNDRPIDLAFKVDSPRALIEGQAAKIDGKVGSELLQLVVDLGLQQQPAPAVNGGLELDVASVGNLLTWLDRPLPADQPDPGAFRLAAGFKTEGTKVVLEEATLSGEALDLKARGSLEAGEGLTKVALELESGVLDIDRYLPPAKAAGAAAPQSEGGRGGGNPLDAIPDDPFDLSALTGTEADIKVALGGIRAMGYEIGAIDFTAKLAGGQLQADLNQLALYGGAVTAQVALDGSGSALGVDAVAGLDKVNLGKLAAVATGGDAPIAGIASGQLTAKGSGENPRALVQSLTGGLDFKLGEVKSAAGALTAVDLKLDLPGLSQSPSLAGNIVYNKRKVAFDLGLDPLDQLLSSDSFATNVKVSSDLVTLSYDGKVQHQPLPGLDGSLSFASPSVGKLLAWAGQPLPKGQPDPGPLALDATLKADGERVELVSASLKGEGLSAEAKGLVELGESETKVALDITGGMLDLDRYMPPPAPAEETAEAAPSGDAGGDPLAALPSEPIDISALKGLEADIAIALEGIKASGVTVAPVNIAAMAADGKLTLDIKELGLSGSTTSGRLALAPAGDAVSAEVALKVRSLDLEPILAAGGGPAPLSGIAGLDLTAKTQGVSPRAMAEGLSAKLDATLDQANVAAMEGASIDGLKLSLDMPGLSQATAVKLAMVFNGETVNLDLGVDTPSKAMGGEAFGLKVALASKPITASVDGQVHQQPLPGLDGSLATDIPSVGALMAWLGQPLPEGQPDPGPLKLAGSLATGGGKVTLEGLDITGKAVKATAKGFVDTGADVLQFGGDLQIANLDLNAYLPPPSDEPAAEAAPAEEGGLKPWSKEAIDFSGLHAAEGAVNITTGPVLYRDLSIVESAASMTLKGGILDFQLTRLAFDQGTASASAKVDASTGDKADIAYNASLQDLEAKPFLKTFAGMDGLSGRMFMEASGTTNGRSERAFVNRLRGKGSILFRDGAYEGFDLAGTLRSVGSLGVASGGEKPKTDFTELGGTYVIKKGVVMNRDFKMLAPLVRVKGAGDVPLPPQTLDYTVEATLTSSLEGQGGEEAIAGLPIPVRATGKWDNITYDVDWASVFAAAALDPNRMAAMPDDMKGLAEGFGVNLGGGDDGGLLGGVGSAVEGLLGGGSDDSGGDSGGGAGEVIDDALQNLFGN